MAEYISREAVLSKCDDMWDNADETTQTGVDTINTIDKITDFIESLPIADVQPVKHGKWLINPNISHEPFCSECKETPCYRSFLPKFCPNCGARMDGDTE